ncbi:hypothetical protein QTP86_003064 [Hemibagrus guttatus]|nr:hypothetical protein QTP86_003064 [Hemibagrus guttatus]
MPQMEHSPSVKATAPTGTIHVRDPPVSAHTHRSAGTAYAQWLKTREPRPARDAGAIRLSEELSQKKREDTLAEETLVVRLSIGYSKFFFVRTTLSPPRLEEKSGGAYGPRTKRREGERGRGKKNSIRGTLKAVEMAKIPGSITPSLKLQLLLISNIINIMLPCLMKLRQALGGQVVLPDDWETTVEVIRETGRKVLGVSSGRRKEDKETWWWNEEVQDSIQRKTLAKKKWDMDRTEENRQEYKELQCRVKREVSKTKQKAYDELYTRLDTREGEKDLYRLARQRDRDGKDVQQVRVIKDRDGRVLTSEESVQRRWKEYFKGADE